MDRSCSAATQPKDGRFYEVMGWIAIAIAIAGFAPGMIEIDVRNGPMTLALAGHGAAFFAWLILFITQVKLYSKGRLTLHRLLGRAGVVLAIVMIVSGYFTAITMVRRGYDLSGDLAATAEEARIVLAFQLGDILAFGVLVTLAVCYRRNPETHKRLMLLATLGTLMPAALAHVIGHSPFLREIEAPIVLIPYTALLFANAVYDWLARGRIHAVSLWGAIAVWLWANIRAVLVVPSQHWHDFAEWLCN